MQYVTRRAVRGGLALCEKSKDGSYAPGRGRHLMWIVKEVEQFSRQREYGTREPHEPESPTQSEVSEDIWCIPEEAGRPGARRPRDLFPAHESKPPGASGGAGEARGWQTFHSSELALQPLSAGQTRERTQALG